MQQANHQFTLLNRQLDLYRYPPRHQHVSLQAWDAADEYLVNYIAEQAIPTPSVSIFNDDFGALGCWFSQQDVQWINDSHIAHLALRHNLQANDLNGDSIQCQYALSPLQNTAVVLLKIPKTLALLEHQLIQLQAVVSPHTRIIAAGKVTRIQKSTLALFEKHLGATQTSLAKKKARLIFCQPSGAIQSTNPYPTKWPLENSGLTLVNHANVFSRHSLDIGARSFLPWLPDSDGKKVIDLGCGNGVLGLSLLERYPDTQVTFVDESDMAIHSVQAAVKLNFAEKWPQCRFLLSNCLESWPKEAGKVDLVICNPPFHQQNTLTEHIAWQMFSDAKKQLNPGGELRIVANRHLPYPPKLKRLFGGYKVIASDRKFSILSAIKR